MSGRSINNSGFTLLEVLVALAIIAIALTSLFSSQSTSLSLAIESKFNTTSALLARELYARYSSGQLPYSSDEGDFGEEFPGYGWKTEVEEARFEGLETGSGEKMRLYRVDCTISWNETAYVAEFSWYGQEAGDDG